MNFPTKEIFNWGALKVRVIFDGQSNGFGQFGGFFPISRNTEIDQLGTDPTHDPESAMTSNGQLFVFINLEGMVSDHFLLLRRQVFISDS